MNILRKIKSKISSYIPNNIKRTIKRTINRFYHQENIIEAKEKWNKLADKNARYFIMTDIDENIDEQKFRETGEKDYKDLILNDLLIKNQLVDFNKKSVLEIGCGIGRITEFISQDFKSVSGIDISSKMIETAKARLKNKNNINFYETDGQNYPFENELFDFVFSFIVFQHMPDKKIIEKNLREIKRVLRINGIAKIQFRGLPTSKKNWFYGPDFTKNEISKMAEKIGLSIIKYSGEGERYFWVWFKKEN